jgi:hypothetical protein
MCCPVDSASGKVFCGGTTFLAVSAITLLVVGILGASGAIHMAPTGADWMIGIGSAIILGMIVGVLKVCCKR